MTVSMKRVIVQKNGTTGNGKLIFLAESLEMFLHEANRVLNMSSTVVYTEKGGVVEDIRVIRDDEVLYLSEGEPFVDPKYAVATRPLVNKCNADDSNMCHDQNDWVSLNVGGKRFTTTSSLTSNRTPATATASPIATGSPMKVTPHMSEVERNILMALVNQYRDAIESRRNDSTAVQRKAIAWAYVEKEYNTQPMVRNQRTKKQLRKAYENLKMRSKKDIMKKQKLVKPEQERRPMPISTGSSMPLVMTESEIPAEIRTLLNPYDVDDNTYHGEASTSNHDDSLSGTEEQADMGAFDCSHLQHHHHHGSSHQQQYIETRSDMIKTTMSENPPNEYRSTEITTKPLTKMFTSTSTIPVPNVPQVQLVSPVAVGEQEPAVSTADMKNMWRKEFCHSSDMSKTYDDYEHMREEKYQPNMEKMAGYQCESEPSAIPDTCCLVNEDVNDTAPSHECEEPQQQLEKQESLKETCIETPSHHELEILILQTKLENERREHKLRIQLLRQQLQYWKKKTTSHKIKD